jgi:Common central domain of tyrosinase
MGVRKNAKFLTAVERENFVRACVSMKADIVNPGAPAANQYSRWDEAVAIHRMIQNANAPGASNVNFGHGGLGAYSFLSWHRYFLYRFEHQLQSYVPGVMLPYWDWTDPAPLMTDTFMGPNGSGPLSAVSRGYFAPARPGTPENTTPLPAWWPAGLNGWNLVTGFGTSSGPLLRSISDASDLPSVSDVRSTLSRTTYSSFQNTLESGSGLTSGHQMHNGLHMWFGGHMASLTGSPFDPIFYLHHCNIDRLWAMWQMDGHATLYPAAGARPQHGPTDAMYPWVGAAAAQYSSNLSFGSIVMPDFSALGTVRNIDTLDHRSLGYTYDTLAVIGIGLDRTGSMNGLTPDPMTGTDTVTKWEAAKRGVSAFLQDCETVQDSGATYVVAGIKTFRSTSGGNDFASVFPGTPYGLVKNGTAYSQGTFDSSIAAVTPGGGTPLADALQDVQDTLVAPPFGWLPADEQRYLAILTDGMLTSGSPMSSIADGAFANTVIFTMGFGTAADVDYGTLASMVAKGRSLGFTQVFHGENVGVIDKFYSNALARALGFVSVFDPVMELFAGEHTHMEFSATSADEAFFLTAQGMDFEDPSWSFALVGPDGHTAYTDGLHHAHGAAPGHSGRMPHVTAKRRNGRLSLMLQRDSAPASSWVGTWKLMIAYRAKDMSAMVMPDVGELMFPVAAGPVRGPRYARLLQPASKRIPARAVLSAPRHQLDVRPGSTNRSTKDASSIVVNIYSRSGLRMELTAPTKLMAAGGELKVTISADVLAGGTVGSRAFARMVAPTQDIKALVARLKPEDLPEEALLKGSQSLKFDPARVLARMEADNAKLGQMRDEEVRVVSHHDGPLHMHVLTDAVPGVYHFGVHIEGAYCPEASVSPGGHGATHDRHQEAKPAHHASTGLPARTYERFTRLLNLSVAVERGPNSAK